jgi:hypothetical protein
MNDNDEVEKSVSEHVIWCRGERDRLAHELDQYQKGFLSIGEQKIGAPVTQGTITHVAYLQRNIGQLDRVIAAYAPRYE